MSTATQPSEADRLRQQMADMRRELHEDVEDVVGQAKELTDWKHYLRKHPFVCLGAAAAVGFLVVPNKTWVTRPAAGQLEELAKRDNLVVKPCTTTGSASAGWKKKALAFGANLLLKAAISYAGQQFGKVVGDQAGGSGSSNQS